jgi:hypothetical protein
MSDTNVQTPEAEAAEADAASINGAVTPTPLVNGAPLTNLEERIEAEVAKRRDTMRARAAFGDELYRHVRTILAGYRKLDSKNIPAPARKALDEAAKFVDAIDRATNPQS